MARDSMTKVLSYALVVLVHMSCLLMLGTTTVTAGQIEPVSVRRLVRVVPLESIPVVSLGPLQRNLIPVIVSSPGGVVRQLARNRSQLLSRLVAEAGLPVNLLRPNPRRVVGVAPLVSERRVKSRVIPLRSLDPVFRRGGDNSVFTRRRKDNIQPNVVIHRPSGANSAAPAVTGADRHWGYDDYSYGTLGPSRWFEEFPTCSNRYQSPIDISGPTITYRAMPPLIIFTPDGSGSTNVMITNKGVSVSINCVENNVMFSGGNLPGTYILGNIHFHWGRTNEAGSEHKLLGKTYPVEMHLVTYNSKYNNLMDAAGKENGVHVVAIFFEISRAGNHGLDFCIENLAGVREPGSEIQGGRLNISSLMPGPNTPFYRYRGTTTTPPCQEHVIWTAYATPQLISLSQLNQFRQLNLDVDLDPFVGGSVRPVQPLDDRIILTNNPYLT